MDGENIVLSASKITRVTTNRVTFPVNDCTTRINKAIISKSQVVFNTAANTLCGGEVCGVHHPLFPEEGHELLSE